VSGNVLFLLELLFGSGIVLGFAVRELISLKRERQRSEAAKRAEGTGQPPS